MRTDSSFFFGCNLAGFASNRLNVGFDVELDIREEKSGKTLRRQGALRTKSLPSFEVGLFHA